MVLLKNRKQTLPLKKTGTIALIGPLAEATDRHDGQLVGCRRSGANRSPCWKACAMRSATRRRLVYARGANVTTDKKVVEYLNFLNWDKPGGHAGQAAHRPR